MSPDSERIAYITGNMPLVHVIHSAEEQIEDLQAQLEEMTDDRNKLRDALTECVEQMEAMQTDVEDFCNEETIRRVLDRHVALHADQIIDELGNEPTTDVSEEFKDAIEQAEGALANNASQEDDTKLDQIRQLTKQVADLQGRLDGLSSSRAAAASLASIVRLVLRPYSAKTGPAWAETLKKALE
jgi:chromosome segregation ATPase